MRWSIALEGGPKRVNHAACAVGDIIYSFGGYCSEEDYDKKRPIDVHALDSVTLRWGLLKCRAAVAPLTSLDNLGRRPSTSNRRSIPYQRYGHTVVVYKGMIYLWGGRNDGDGASNLLHQFDPETNIWSVLETKGRKPPARDGHSACVYNNKMIIFGGFEEEFQRFSQETFVFCFDTAEWKLLHTNGLAPAWRDFHTACMIDDRMYIFGGRSDQLGQFHSNQELYYEKLKYLCINDYTWYDAEVRGDTKPCGRRSHTAWSRDGLMYVFGGYSGSARKHFGDFYCYDPRTCRWSQLVIEGKAPQPRRRQCTVMVKDKLYLFGGTKPIQRDFPPIHLVHGGGGALVPPIEIDDAEVLDNPPQAQVAQALGGGGGGHQAAVAFLWVERNLVDLSDLYVLDYSPTLRSLCLNVLIDRKMHLLDEAWSVLPMEIRSDIAARTTANRVSTTARMDTSG